MIMAVGSRTHQASGVLCTQDNEQPHFNLNPIVDPPLGHKCRLDPQQDTSCAAIFNESNTQLTEVDHPDELNSGGSAVMQGLFG